MTLVRLVQAYTAILRSPTEYESTPAVSALMQSYFLKLLSRYRDFIEADVPDLPSVSQQPNSQASDNPRSEMASRTSSNRQASHSGPEDDGGYLR